MTEQTEFDIIYTKVDEAPQLASASLLPIIRAFAGAADVTFGTKDISLAGRIIAAFPEGLSDAQRQPENIGSQRTKQSHWVGLRHCFWKNQTGNN